MLIRKITKQDIKDLDYPAKDALSKTLIEILFQSIIPLSVEDKKQLIKNILAIGIYKKFDLGDTIYKLNKNGTVTELKEGN